MSTEKKEPQTKIDDLAEPTNAARDAENVKGGRMRSGPTESGDVTPGPNGGDTG